jgi:hypothetical protein
LPDEVYQTPLVASKKCGLLYRYGNVWLLASNFSSSKKIQQINEFSLNNDDIVVVSFPKSGTTWLQHIVTLIMLDSSKVGDDRNIEQKFPYLEYEYPGLQEIAKLPSPRLIKSHMPYSSLPADIHTGKAKVLYIARNAKDVCVSYYYFARMLSVFSYQGSFIDFFNQFTSGQVFYGPYWVHVGEFWDHRKDNNIHFIQYEELHMDPEKVIRQVAEFLGRTLTDQQVADIVSQSSFKSMKDNPTVNYSWWDSLGLRRKEESEFLRKGVVGDWKNHFTAEMERRIHETCVEPLEQRGLIFTDFMSGNSGQE